MSVPAEGAPDAYGDPVLVPRDLRGVAVYTVDEVARILRLSRGATYALLRREGGPPCFRAGTTIRVPARGLVEWMQSQRGGNKA
jgi:excisionase family DNA binding protein